MTPAEELTQAADKLDALLADTTDGPWTLTNRSDGSVLGIDHGYDEVLWPGNVECGSYCYGGTSTIVATDADVRYMAAMNPLVGKALAELFRNEVRQFRRGEGGTHDGLDAFPVRLDLLEIARLINGAVS